MNLFWWYIFGLAPVFFFLISNEIREIDDLTIGNLVVVLSLSVFPVARELPF